MLPACAPLTRSLKQALTVKSFFLITCFSLAISLLWIQATVNHDGTPTDVVQEALETAARDARFAEIYRKSDKLPDNLNYILLWTPDDYAPFYHFGKGQRAFIEKNCSMINCYVTSDRNFFDGDVTKFDAIAFNGRNIRNYKRIQMPRSRSPHQKYIYVMTESADNNPMCTNIFDNFFNWTMTYRLDSDIEAPYIEIVNTDGEFAGPKLDMEWEKDMYEVDEFMIERLQNKSKAAAWFVSHCKCRSGRMAYARKLQAALRPYKLNVDIYGLCGPLKCPVDKGDDCHTILERDYYFYLSFENSFSEDYVTEKLLKALQHDVVPVVFGGANYSRFLPPNSYLDATVLTPTQLAETMASLIRDPIKYREYFKWKYHYTYHNSESTRNVCNLCAAFNNRTKVLEQSVYKDFRKWWHPDHANRCKTLK